MEFVCKRDVLLKNLQIAIQGLSHQKTMLPVLSFLMVEASGKKVSITSTDLEISVKVSFEANVKKEGKVLLHGSIFEEITRVQENADILVAESNENVLISCGKFKAKLAKGVLEEYPQIPDCPKDATKEVSVSAFTLLDAINKTAYSASRDEVRYVLCSQYFEVEKKKLTVASTDGKRLSMIEAACQAKDNLKVSAVVPIKTVFVMEKILSSCEEKEEVKLVILDNVIFCATSDVVLTSRLVDGTYPDFRAVVPKNSKIKAEVSRDEFLSVVTRVASVLHAGVNLQASSIRCHFKKDRVSVFASASGLGEAEEEISATTEGGTINVAFNSVYLIDMLKHIQAKKLVFQFTDSLSAVLVKSEEIPQYLSIVMPMRA